ncbi:MAG TPA: hypothetical protein VFA32_08220, partial [Dehalococcoidia bacterium]|nr:hypothetical protein [Dehalococcoidia bacterium]
MTDFTGPMMAAFQEALADLPGGASGPLKSLRETLGQWAQEVETLPALGQVLDIDDLPVEARRRRFNAAMAAAMKPRRSPRSESRSAWPIYSGPWARCWTG